MPEGLIAPELHDVELIYWSAFWQLSTDRMPGEVKGPIPWSSIEKYGRMNSGLDVNVFAGIIREMDDAYLSHKSGENNTFSRDMLRGR